jgi:hypothetical protein
MDKPTTEPAKVGDVDIEALARNVARLIEEGGKALAAYMKPREEGKIKRELADGITDAVKTMGRVAEYWLSDPISICGPAQSNVWPASKPNRLFRLTPRTSVLPIPSGRRTSSSIFLSRHICSPRNGPTAW